MNIRNKILLYFSAGAMLLTAIAFIMLYWLFSRYREEQFQQQQHRKILYTIKLIDRFKEESAEISNILDAQDINDFYDEKLFVYDNNKQPIFSSLDALEISKKKEIINELSPTDRWIETKEKEYDLIGVYVERNGKGYYAISKAYDSPGYDKLHFLGKLLTILFAAIVVIILFASLYLANNLSKPINRLTYLLKRYDLNKEENIPLDNKTSTKELKYLTEHFNELLQRTREAFTFQKNTINHISHQLKTPVAILVSELEKMQQQDNMDGIREELKIQTQRAKSLGDIISTILEIARIESGKNFQEQNIRIDEIIFDLLEHFKPLYPAFHFHLRFLPESFTEQQMEIKGNELLLKQSLENLLHNSIMYSEDHRAFLAIDTSVSQQIKITITNAGKTITDEERQFLFNYFFRGQNSSGKSGNGLGLMLAQRIIHLHRGQIAYFNNNDINTFELTLPAQSK